MDNLDLVDYLVQLFAIDKINQLPFWDTNLMSKDSVLKCSKQILENYRNLKSSIRTLQKI